MTSKASDLNDHPTQVTILRILYTIVVTLFVFNFGFALHNVVRYVYPMKEKSKLIILFYGLIFMTCIFHIIVYLHLDIDPNGTDPFVLKPHSKTPLYLLELIASVSMLALGWLVTTMMLQISFSIRAIFDLIDKASATKYMNWMYIYACFWVVA